MLIQKRGPAVDSSLCAICHWALVWRLFVLIEANVLKNNSTLHDWVKHLEENDKKKSGQWRNKHPQRNEFESFKGFVELGKYYTILASQSVEMFGECTSPIRRICNPAYVNIFFVDFCFILQGTSFQICIQWCYIKYQWAREARNMRCSVHQVFMSTGVRRR